ncbi:hypothetical protein GCM10008983_01510 [Lentibacillus halophilus]|uniref:HTH cro/C1-type domain-containing protein n=1 Tax=Lentibacillus halophilus TaxID=295065 RepID=A0ABN0Z1M8_9BACI
MEEIDQFKQLLGKQLREKRKQKGLSIQRVAEHAHTGTDHLGRIERGEKQPTAYTLSKLIDYLNMDPGVTLEIMNELKKHRPD